MAGLLVAIGAIGILISVALPVWSQNAKREREAELVFRGEQYARAIELYQRQYVGAYPPDLETLVEQRFLRRLYRDPMTEDGEFRAVYRSQVDDLQGNVATADRPGEQAAALTESIVFDDDADQTGGVVGVVSRSDEESLRVYNGRRKYSEWVFLHATDQMDTGAVNGEVDLAPSQGNAGRDSFGGDPIRFDRGGQSEPGGNAGGVGGGNRP
jgi:type II secretory pathway pseudopilin PulG